MTDLLSIFAEDKQLITYRPRLREIAGSVTSTILFQQMLYWWEKMERRPFYKFSAPCEHDAYNKGDSWQEELGFSRAEFDTALKKIAKKITKGTDKTQALEKHLVIYWTDSSRMTWYQINTDLVQGKLAQLYLGNVGTQHYLEEQETDNTFITETTTETTTNTPTAADVLETTVNFDKELFGDAADRPKGWRACSEDEYAICERVAQHWRNGILPGQVKFIEESLAGAAELLTMFGGDGREALKIIDEFHRDYRQRNRDFTVKGPSSLVNEIPAFISKRRPHKQEPDTYNDPMTKAFRELREQQEREAQENGGTSQGNGATVGDVKPKGSGNGTGRPRRALPTTRYAGP